jgi:methylated-DNA-[protein]-cysteine S-methyltransferase
MLKYDIYDAPIGRILVIVSKKGVCRVELFEENWPAYHSLQRDEIACREVINQLSEYFAGKRKIFDLSLDIQGTDFRKQVWKSLSDIPYGKTLSYKQVAEKIGNPKAVRAVGQANKANLLPIIIPCHRVIGNNGKLVGFAGDKIDVKRYLLKHEGFLID